MLELHYEQDHRSVFEITNRTSLIVQNVAV